MVPIKRGGIAGVVPSPRPLPSIALPRLCPARGLLEGPPPVLPQLSQFAQLAQQPGWRGQLRQARLQDGD